MLRYLPFKYENSQLIASLKCLVILCLLAWTVFYSLRVAINIPTNHLDGAFQTASGLYRLAAGQFPGKDFFPYLGIGPLFLLYPIFKICGANLAASVFSAQLMVLLVGFLSTAFIWHLIWQPKSFLTSLVAGGLLFLGPIDIILTHYLFYISPASGKWIWLIYGNGAIFNIVVGNSLRPLRVAAPYLMALIFYFFAPKINSAKKYPLFGLLTGVILLWSNDFAFPTAGLFAVFIFIKAWWSKELQMRNVCAYLFTTIFVWIALLTLATHGHPLEFLQYNFVDVTHDQWWLFAPYAESKRICSLLQLDKLLYQDNCIIFLFVIAVLAVIALQTRKLEYALLLWIGVVLFVGGAVASIGGHFDGYFNGFYFWGMMTTYIVFFRLLWLGFKKLFICKAKYTWQIIFLFGFLGIAVFLMLLSFSYLRTEQNMAKNDTNRFYVQQLGGYLNKDWEDYIKLAANSKDVNVFEEYWGIWSATRKTFSGWPVDAVIHALGSKRDVASQQLKKADLVISTRYSFSPKWQPWNLSQNYWFYADLLKEWSPFFLSPTTIIWHKNKQARLFHEVSCNIIKNNVPALSFQAYPPGIYEIEMQYSFVSTNRALIMIKNNISFPNDANGYISIDSKATRVKFPAYAAKAGNVLLDTKLIGADKDNFKIQSCIAKYIPFTNKEVY